MQAAVVVGVSGTIGRALADRLRHDGRRVIGVSRNVVSPDDIRLDVTTPASTWPTWPAAEVTYLCVGGGGLDACERDPSGTRRVHVDAVAELADHATSRGSRVVFVSSAHVFDGTASAARADDPRRPATVYGRHKAEAEVAVLACAGAAVLRVSKIIGPGDSRLRSWRSALLAGHHVKAFDDVNVAPLSVADAARALVDIGEYGQPGTFQLSGADDATYFSMALALAAQLGASASLVVGTSAAATGVPPSFRPSGVRLEMRLPRPFAPAPLDVVVARGLA